MSACFYCGKPTVIYHAGEPVCIECSEMIDAGKRPVKRSNAGRAPREGDKKDPPRR